MPLTNPLFTPPVLEEWTRGAGTQDERESYLFRDERIALAVNVALATRRPLLVTGPPGAGKSSLARAVAHAKCWTYIERVVNSRTELRDLTAGSDTVRRLANAQVEDGLLPDWAYIEPGVLWWAFDADSARQRGRRHAVALTAEQLERLPEVPDPRVREPDSAADVVLLLDEIDKAEPDLANDLLGPLDGFGFHVPEEGRVTATNDVFVVITSNQERRLPSAFLRRCVQLQLRLGSGDRTTVEPAVAEFFAAVAAARFGDRTDTLYADVAEKVEIARRAAIRRSRREPSTAEFLDTVRACLRFDITPASPEWRGLVETALWKDPNVPPEVFSATATG